MIALKLTIEDIKDPSFEKIIQEVRKLNLSYVSVGFHNTAGQYPDGTNIVQVAAWNEFGTEHSPERSFIRSAIDDNAAKLDKWRYEAIQNILENGWTAEKALEMIGFRLQILIQNKIKSNVPPPNAPSTIAQKAADGVAPNTLQWTGLMLRSVTYRVVMK